MVEVVTNMGGSQRRPRGAPRDWIDVRVYGYGGCVGWKEEARGVDLGLYRRRMERSNGRDYKEDQGVVRATVSSVTCSFYSCREWKRPDVLSIYTFRVQCEASDHLLG